VKDVLHLLEKAGLLASPLPTEFPSDEIHSALFPDLVARPITAGETETQRTETQRTENTSGGELSETGSSPLMGQPADLPTFSQVTRKSKLAAPPSSARPSIFCRDSSKSNISSSLNIPRGASSVPASARASARHSVDQPEIESTSAAPMLQIEPEVLVEASPSEVLACDFKLSILEVLKLLSEVASPYSVQKLCWAVDAQDAAQEELIGILDFIESELTFCEFQRLLVRISEEKTQGLDPGLAWRLPIHRRLEGFLAHVLLPSLEGAPKEIKSEVEKPSEDPESSPADPAVASVNDADETAGTEHAVEAPAPETLDTESFHLWRGFDDGDLDCKEEEGASRVWLEDFELSIGSW